MIDKSEVNAAFAAAKRTLAEESNRAWIKKSALLERAYFLGLFGGLSGIASKEDVGHILTHVLEETLFERSADDSFQSTRTGVLFDSVRQELRREEVDRPALLAAIQRLADHVDALDRGWNSRLEHTRMLLTRLTRLAGSGNAEENAEQRDSQRGEIHRFAEELEPLARHIALVETDHRLSRLLPE